MHQGLTTKAASTAKYARDIAAEMGISEAELTAARLGHDAVRLSDDARALIAALERVGETKCICRNEYAVHEQVGQFTHQHLSGHAGLVLNPRALDLRLFLSQWASAFHLNDNGRQSIQFFDHHGDALLKVYATTQTDMAAWDTLIAEYRVAAPAPLTLRPLEPVKYEMTAVFSQREGLAFNDALAETLLNEHRFRRLNAQQPEVAEQLWKDAAADLQKRYDFLAQLAGKAEKSPSEG